MKTFLWVVVGLTQAFLLLISALRLSQYELSDFAFRQQLEHHSGDAAKLRRRLHKLLPEIRVLQKTELITAGTLLVALLTHLNRPVLGVIYSLISFAVIAMLGKLQIVQAVATKLFESTLDLVLKTTETFHPLWVLLGVPSKAVSVQPSSLAEFNDQLRRLPSTVVSPLQRQRLESVLASEDKRVGDIMTPKKRVVMVEPTATLGPVVLSDLQKSGHGYFPVATKKGEPEGILTLGDVADIHLAKQRTSVRDLMALQIAWVTQDATLYELADVFLRDKQYLAFVRNEEGQFSGVVTVADLMKHLLGIVKD